MIAGPAGNDANLENAKSETTTQALQIDEIGPMSEKARHSAKEIRPKSATMVFVALTQTQN